MNDIQIKKQNLSDIIVHLENEIQILKRSLEDKTTDIQKFQSQLEVLNVQKQNLLKEVLVYFLININIRLRINLSNKYFIYLAKK